MFNEARNMTEGGTIDIYKYQKMYHEGIVKKPIPHLLIICDEFAELKQQQPEFMDELMSVSRIGRSLGVHLILATQKPAGIVNDQIRSNSKFAVYLKVQDKEDSIDVIKRPDAATLKTAGQFYLQVGNDEYFVLGQSGWAGASYYPSDVIEKKVDNSIQLISNIGTTIKQADDRLQKVLIDKGEQLTNIVKYLYLLGKQQGVESEPLWLDTIPETIFVKDIRKKYQVKVKKNQINPIIGEYDDPSNQRQGAVELDFSSLGNTVIYGNAESGKETFLSTMVYDVITTYTSEEVQLYLLDFGTETLKLYRECPQVGDVVFINDKEKIDRLFNMLQEIMKERKDELLQYNGDYDLYLKTSGKKMPMIIIVINNWDVFSETYGTDYEDAFQTIERESTKCGIVFVVTANAYNSMRYRLTQNFKNKIALQLNDENDYYNIFEGVGKKRPSHIFGRGLLELKDKEVYEFQTAKICEPEQYLQRIKEEIEKLKQNAYEKAPRIPVLPDKVTFQEIKKNINGISQIPLGIIEKNLKVANYDFKKNFATLITSKNMEDAIQFTANIIDELKNIKNVDTIIFDAERSISSKRIDLKDQYTAFITKLNKENKNHTICIFIGIDKFLADYTNTGSNFNTIIKQLDEKQNYSIIVVENANKMKIHEFEEWYKNYITKEKGIWVGNGIDSQYLITINSSRKELVNNCGRSFGYIIKDGIATLIKLLEMKEDEDNE